VRIIIYTMTSRVRSRYITFVDVQLFFIVYVTSIERKTRQRSYNVTDIMIMIDKNQAWSEINDPKIRLFANRELLFSTFHQETRGRVSRFLGPSLIDRRHAQSFSRDATLALGSGRDAAQHLRHPSRRVIRYETVRHGTFTNDRVARILSRILSSLLSSRARETCARLYARTCTRARAASSACASRSLFQRNPPWCFQPDDTFINSRFSCFDDNAFPLSLSLSLSLSVEGSCSPPRHDDRHEGQLFASRVSREETEVRECTSCALHLSMLSSIYSRLSRSRVFYLAVKVRQAPSSCCLLLRLIEYYLY